MTCWLSPPTNCQTYYYNYDPVNGFIHMLILLYSYLGTTFSKQWNSNSVHAGVSKFFIIGGTS